MRMIYFNILFLIIITFKGLCQPGCKEPYNGNILLITYGEIDKVSKPLKEGEFMKYDTITIDNTSSCSCQIFNPIELSFEDTIKLKILTNNGLINIYLFNNNVLTNENPSCFVLIGLPKSKGTYYVRLKKKEKIDFKMICCYNITPGNWENCKLKTD